MTIQRISLNINGSNFINREYILDWLGKFKPTTILCMDNYNLAISLAAALPNTKVTHRSYSETEHIMWQRETPAAYVARETAWGHPEIIRSVTNEPPVGNPKMISWHVEVAQRLADKGYGSALMALAVGSYEKHHVEDGYFDPILALNLPNTWIAIHEYTSILAPFGASMWPLEQLYDKSRVQRDEWPERSELLITRQPNGDLPNRWHFLRSSWLTIRAQEKGYGVPKYWVTEWGLDSLPDLGQQGVLDFFKNKYGIPAPHTSIRGVNTLRPIYADYFPQWNFEQAVFEQYKWLETIYPDNYVGFNIFTINGNHDWKVDAGTDYSELHNFFTHLLTEKIVTPPTQPPAPPVVDIPFPSTGLVPATLAPVESTANVRIQPKLGAQVIGVLDTTVHGEIALNATYNDGGFLWYPIRFNGVQGWARGDVITITADVPPPTDTDAPKTFTVSLRPSEVAALSKLLEQLR